ncbi:hypothetical protein Bbelb_418610 [Branchiostoma belcheri]|nr:hypothetical protein Bbelb_418610 [Branchiostoma belcheri]
MTPVHSVLPGNPRVIDMTHTFDENTIFWPTLRHFKRTGVLRNYTADSTWREESDIEGAEHGGTHLDAPAHFSKNKWRSHDIPVERLMGPAAVVDVSSKAAADADYLVTAEDFQLWEEKHGKIPDGCLLFNTRNTSLLHFPGLHPDGARWLVQNRGMHAVGIDTASIDYGQSKKYEAHQILLAHNVLAFENVANMDKLPTTGATVYALPIKIGDGSGGPARIIGIIENTKNPVKTPRPGQGQQVIDMTYTLDDTTLYRPGRKPFRLADVFRNYTGEYYYEGSVIETTEHGGTHMDAPVHFSKNKWKNDDIPVERLMGPAAVVDVSPKTAADADYLVTAEDFQLWEEKHGKIPDGCLLFGGYTDSDHDMNVRIAQAWSALHSLRKTGWGKFWPNELLYLGTDSRNTSLLHFPGLHPDGARWLVQNRGMHAVGIDMASIDYGQSTVYEAYQALFGNNIPVFENVANLDQLPAVGSVVFALPMKIGGGSGGPARIVGFVNKHEYSPPHVDL